MIAETGRLEGGDYDDVIADRKDLWKVGDDNGQQREWGCRKDDTRNRERKRLTNLSGKHD